jgi:hypothetical protein
VAALARLEARQRVGRDFAGVQATGDEDAAEAQDAGEDAQEPDVRRARCRKPEAQAALVACHGVLMQYGVEPPAGAGVALDEILQDQDHGLRGAVRRSTG